MTFKNFKEQCEENLPTKGCENINVDKFLSMNGITYRCKFVYKNETYTIHCNKLGQWSLWRNSDDVELASIGHLYIQQLWERSGL